MVRFYVAGDRELRRIGKFPTDRLGALRDSIKKWKFIAKYYGLGGRIDDGFRYETCALCNLYLVGADCGDCPVAKAGHGACRKTPYEDFAMNRFDENEGGVSALHEVKFLEGILKKETARRKGK